MDACSISGVKKCRKSNIIKATTTRLRMGWCVVFKTVVQRCHLVRSVQVSSSGQVVPSPNRTFNHLSIYWLVTTHVSYDASNRWDIIWILTNTPSSNFVTKNTLVRAGDSSRVGLTRFILIFLGMAEITAVSTYVNIGSQVGLPGEFRLSSCLSELS